MNQPSAAKTQDRVALPAIPALHVDSQKATILTEDGEIQTLPHDQARLILHKKSVLLSHAPYCRSKLGIEQLDTFDLLELFAFVHPARFTVPTAKGLCSALHISAPKTTEDIPLTLIDVAQKLLQDLRNDPYKAKANPLDIAALMGLNSKGWAWTPYIFSALGQKYDPAQPVTGKKALAVWKKLPEWAEEAPPPPASQYGVSKDEAKERLHKLRGFDDAEERAEQIAYSEKITHAFAPIEDEGKPNIVLAEAGTGVGKTLGYLAPASLWAEKNKGAVWISTYTKNLQRQVDQELYRLYPNEDVKDAHVATRKGRENYLCLLNLEEAASAATLSHHISGAIASGIMARWAAASKDGDLTGAAFPGWLAGLLGHQHTSGLADRRGECIYSACDHYKKCFVEHSSRKAQHARIVIANHALVMINAALSTPGEDAPNRYIFDEGHHLFSAADSAYASHLTARESRDLRRWLLGHEGGKRGGRARGLKRRMEDLIEGTPEAEETLHKILDAAECLPMDGWTRRLKDNTPSGECEKFLLEIYRQVNARADGKNSPYSIETETHPANKDTIAAAQKLKSALHKLQTPMQNLSNILHKQLADDNGEMSGDTRRRIEAISTSIDRRAALTLQSWTLMLEDLLKDQQNPAFIDWMEIERIEGRAIDVGLYRHHIDPMKPFAASLHPHLHGMAITSATLRDNEDGSDSWTNAQKITGAAYLAPDTINASYKSPFDYKNRTKIFIINDVNKNDLNQISAAYRALFTAANGGALGLFTAISRLRAVHEKVAPTLEQSGLPLYAQHIDHIDTGTLIDMFREEENACLLGTDAIRDGVDVPGKSLRMIVFDRTPWPRPTILHKARREAFGGRKYDEMLTRLKLKQAFGRLIRREKDKGVFVMLDSALPSRLHNAFPEDAEIIKTDLKTALDDIKHFLQQN